MWSHTLLGIDDFGKKSKWLDEILSLKTEDRRHFKLAWLKSET